MMQVSVLLHGVESMGRCWWKMGFGGMSGERRKVRAQTVR